MNTCAVKVIYKYEMLRARETLLQSLVSPVVSTALYFGGGYLFGDMDGERKGSVARETTWSWRVNYGYTGNHNIVPEPMQGNFSESTDVQTNIGGLTLGWLAQSGERVDIYAKAALYRHFPSKAKMFEGLIEFVEDTIFSLANRILAEEKDAVTRCEKLCLLLLGFSEKNPGMTRLLVGDALTGEHARLRVRVSQFYDRIETQLKQILREARLHGQAMTDDQVQTRSSLLLAIVEGRLQQFVRSGFERSPLAQWSGQGAGRRRTSICCTSLRIWLLIV